MNRTGPDRTDAISATPRTVPARAELGGAGHAAEVSARVRMRPSDAESDVAIGDWDALLGAVKARLRLTVGERLAVTADPLAPDTAGRIRTSVLECVAALDQLHATLTHELRRRQQLELDVFETRAELAQAQAELVGTQAGEQRARHLALHDALTALPNRRFFGQRIADALAEVEPRRRALAVLYLDLDGFKAINDAHGHDTGDEMLRIVAARLTRAIRTEDMVSRLGGDEFACLLGGFPDREQLCHLACKLFDAVSAPVKIAALQLVVRPSIGIAMCPADGMTAETLLESADAAMYFAKRRQTGYAFFDQLADG